MLLTLLTLAFIGGLTAFLASQGTLTAIFTFFSAAFAAVLAIGLMPALAPLIGGLWRPDLGMGLAFLGVFSITFSILRIGTDVMVPSDIHLPPLINRVGGGIVGFLASTVVMGSLLIGITLLPLPETILGGANLVKSDDNDQIEANMPFPVKFTGAILNMANGGAQGGRDLASVYPDLPLALASYRHTVQAGSKTALLPDMVELRGWYVPNAADLKSRGIPTDKGVPTVVRTVIKNGSDAGSALDNDPYLRLTPQQVRLIARSTTGSGYKQYNPIGMLEKGDRFVKLTDDPLNQSMADDTNDQNQIIHDWVFAVDDGYTPANIEIKSGGLASFSDKAEPRELEQLKGVQYPPRKYLKDQSTVQVMVRTDEGVLAKAQIWVLKPSVQRRFINLVQQAHTDTENKMSAAATSASPGTLSSGDYRADLNTLLEIRNAGAGDVIAWSRVLVPLIKSRTEVSDGRRNISVVLPNFVEQTLRKVFQDSDSQVLTTQTGEDGMTARETIAPGSYLFFAYAKTDDAFRVWVIEKKIEPKATVQIDMTNPTFKLVIK